MNEPVELPIKSKTQTIQQCFKQCLYEIPTFQRDYSWGKEQLEEYWNDVVKSRGDFFFGSTVTWISQKRELFNDTFSVIDGQQRLTTSAIALSVIRDAFYLLAEAPNASSDNSSAAKQQGETTQKYLINEDDDGTEYRVIKRKEEVFYNEIQRPNSIPSKMEYTASARRIVEARELLESWVMDEIKGVSVVEGIEKLKAIRNNVLKAKLIQVEMASEEDSFLVFETLNARGADLRLADLTKNLLVRGSSSNSTDRETVADRWKRMADLVVGGSTNPEVLDLFIWQSWNSRRDAVKQPELFKKISQMVARDPEKHVDYLEELEEDCEVYRKLGDENILPSRSAHGVKDAFAVDEFVDSVRALAIFKISVANSAIFAVVRKYNNGGLVKKAQLIEVIQAIEAFHFQFNALTNTGSTGGTRGRYNRFAVELEQADSREKVHDVIQTFIERLRDSLPSRDKVIKAIEGLFYAPNIKIKQSQKLKARKIFISYFLMGIAKSQKLQPSGQNFQAWSIEHVRPQSLALSNKSSDLTYNIGNLVLVTKELNVDLADGEFSKKVGSLREGCACFDDALASWPDSSPSVPTDDHIRKRAEWLANLAVDKAWRV